MPKDRKINILMEEVNQESKLGLGISLIYYYTILMQC